MAMVPTQFSELLEPILREVIGLKDTQFTPEYQEIFEILGSEKYQEHYISLAGAGLMKSKPVGSSVSYDTGGQGIRTTITHSTYSLGIQITRELLEDDLYNAVKSLADSLSISKNQTIETIAANTLNNGHSGSYLGADGKSLFAVDHPLIKGGTFSNRLSTPASISVTSLQAMSIALASIPTESGLKMKVMPRKLLIAPNSDFITRQVLKTQLLPGTANNDINPAYNIFPEGHVVLHWLANTGPAAMNWYVKTDVSSGLIWFWRRKPDFAQDNSFDTDTAKYKVTMRCSSGWVNPRSAFSNGGLL